MRLHCASRNSSSNPIRCRQGSPALAIPAAIRPTPWPFAVEPLAAGPRPSSRLPRVTSKRRRRLLQIEMRTTFKMTMIRI